MFEVAIERGPKRRTFAQVQSWIGWLRAGKDEHVALKELVDSSARYAIVADRAGVPFTLPASLADFTIVERVAGTAVTDFGAPASSVLSTLSPGKKRRSTGLLRSGPFSLTTLSLFSSLSDN